MTGKQPISISTVIPIDFTDPARREIPWFDNYLKRCFRISTERDAPPIPLETFSILLDEDSMTIEMQGNLPGKPKSLYIYNALLTDIYPDQTNLVILGYRDRETGMKFDMKNHGDVVQLK